MKKLLTFLTLLTLSIGVGWAATKTDVLTAQLVQVGNSYGEYTYTSSNNVDYNLYCMSDNSQTLIQLRSKNSNSGIVSTSSIGTIKKVVVEWASNNTGNKIDIYGKNTAYSTPSDLYDTSKQGTKLGSLTSASPATTELVINGSYNYIGIRSNNGAVYLNKITITWETGGGTTVETVATPTFNPAEGTFTEAQNVTISCATDGATIYYTTDGNDPTTSSTEYTEAIDISSTATIKAIAVKSGMNNSAVATATYTINSSGGNTSNAMIMFDDNGTDATNDVTSATLLEYTIEGASYVSSYSDIYKVYKAITGIKFSSSKVNGNLTINLSSIAQQPLSKIIVNAKKYDNDDASLSVDGTSTGSLTADYADYEITCDGTAKTSITLEATNRLYVKYINLVFVEQGDHTITVDDAIENGTVTASRETANANDPVTVTVTPDPGYELSTLTVDGTDVTNSVSNNSYTFNMPAHSVTITATFTLKKNKVSYTIAPANTGEVWLNNGTTYDQALGYSYSTMGTTVEIALAAYAGYDVNSLTITDEGGATVSYTTYNSEWRDGKWVTYYSFVMPATPVNIAATFKSGDIYILGTANDNPWDGNKGVKMTYDANTNTYSANVYFATATNTGKGQFSFASNLSGSDGSWDNIGKRWGAQSQDYDLVTNSSGGNWTDNMNSEDDYNRFAVPYGVYEIKVNWGTGLVTATKKDITVTLDKASGQLETGTTVNVSSNLSTLLQGCKSGVNATLAYSTDDGANYTDGNSFVVDETMIAKGKAYYGTIEAESESYAYNTITHYAVTATANPSKGGIVSVSPTSALAGETVTITANPKSGYELTSITVNGDELTLVEGQTEYTFIMPSQSTEVVANFTAKTLHLTINNENSKGTVYGVPATSTVGSEISFNVTPKDGYAVNTVTYSFTPTGGTENTTTLTAPYSFNMPGYDVTIDITYTEQSSGSGGDATDLYHESFGNNPNSARDWKDSYSVKTGVEDVYSGITGYTVSNVKQGKNTTGYIESGLNQSSSGTDASIIIGPLNVANYTDLVLSYYWKAASINGTYTTNLYYATSADGTYTEVEGTGNGATSFVKRTYNLPETAQVSTLYLKIVYNTSNTQAIIDEVNLAGVPNGVQAPVFTPTQGIYGIDVDVTISCPTNGATIYYTDDESDPKTSTTRKEYTGEIVVSETTTFKAYAEKDGLSSDVVTATYTINKNTEIETVTLDYIETFTGSDGIGKFTIINESGYSPIWSLDGNYGVKGTAYNPNTTPTNNAATSRLVSPIIDLSAANLPELTFSHQINSYFNNPSAQCKVFIRETTDGTSGTWEQLPVTVTVPASGSWSNDFARIDLSNYIDKKIQISFLYTNPEAGSGAGTWEIQNFKVADNTDIVIVNNIAEFMNTTKVSQGEKAKFRNPVVVLYHYQQYYNYEQGDYDNDYIWIKDDSGYAIVYGHYLDVEYVNGDVIPAGFTATKNYYATGGFDQLYEPEGLQPATEKALADPEPVTLAKLNENKDAYNGHYVTISKMQIQFNKGKLVAWSNSSSGQRDFSVGDETLAIENNQAGTSDAIKGYNNFDNPWLETLNYPDYQDKSTVYGDFNITAIFEQYNGTWEFMPIIITPWEPNKMTLHDLCEKGVTTEGQNEYIISNNLMCVFAKDNSIWVKDDTGQSIWMTSPADGDLNFEVYAEAAEGIPANTRLNQAYYDQSNWCEIKLADGIDASQFEGKIIKGGSIHGEFTDKLNPTLENVTLTNAAISSEGDYALNYYMPANFLGRQACQNSSHSTDFGQFYFYMTPKPQEYAQIVWAVYDGVHDGQPTFIMSTSDNDNGHKFEGEFSIDLSMNARELLPSEITNGYGYNFKAIIKKVTSSSKADGDSYMVYPLDLDEGIDPATSINTVDVTGKAVKSVKYVNVAGMVSDVPFQGVNIVVTEYTDGSRTTSKMLRK